MIFHISDQANRNQTISVPVDISFQGIPHSKTIGEVIIKHADRLKHIHADLMQCRVNLAIGTKHQYQGKSFDVNVHMFTPHQTHVSSNASNEDPYVALHEALSHAERMLLEAGNKRSS